MRGKLQVIAAIGLLVCFNMTATADLEQVKAYLQEVMGEQAVPPTAEAANAEALEQLMQQATATGSAEGLAFAKALAAADATLPEVDESAVTTGATMTAEQRQQIARATVMVCRGLFARLQSPGSAADARTAAALLVAIAEHSPSSVSQLQAVNILNVLPMMGNPWCDPAVGLAAWDMWVNAVTATENQALPMEDRVAAVSTLMLMHQELLAAVMQLRVLVLEQTDSEHITAAMAGWTGQFDAMGKAFGEELDPAVVKLMTHMQAYSEKIKEVAIERLRQVPEIRAAAKRMVEALHAGNTQQVLALAGKADKQPPKDTDIEAMVLGRKDVHAGRLLWVIPNGMSGQSLEARVIMTAMDRADADGEPAKTTQISVQWSFKSVDGKMTVGPGR